METSLFGKGFVGGEYVSWYPETLVVERNELLSPTPNILYMISTTTNYNPKDGDILVDVETNLIHFLKVLEANFEKHGEKLVFNLVSTWFVYGHTKVPASEDAPCNPAGFYSITSYAREKLLVSYAELKGFKYRILRLGNVIGVGDKKISRKKNALQYIVSELAKGNTVDYLYERGAIRDFIDVRDCVKAIRLILERGGFNEIFNVANGLGLNVNDLVSVAHRESGYKSEIRHIPVPEFHQQVQTSTMVLDVRKLKNLGYVQAYDIAQSIRGLIHHYEQSG